MNNKVTGLLICVLFTICACESSSKTTETKETNNETLIDNSTSTETNESEETTLERISSLSESAESFEGVTRVGWFEIDESDQIPMVDSSAVFFELGTDNPYTDRAEIFLNTPGDSCFVEFSHSRRETLIGDMTENARTISAGEVITMFEEGAPYKYSELAHVGPATEGSYINYLDLPYPSPALLNISATGEVFSEFSLTVEKPSPLENLSVENGRKINPNASISWSASKDPDTMLHIKLEGRLASFVIDCMLIDDGRFTLPTNASLGIDADAQTILQSAERVRVGSMRVGSDLIVALRMASRYRQ